MAKDLTDYEKYIKLLENEIRQGKINVRDIVKKIDDDAILGIVYVALHRVFEKETKKKLECYCSMNKKHEETEIYHDMNEDNKKSRR